MTKKLFYDDVYMTEFDAEVIGVDSNKAVFDQSAFYPEGGGQDADTGIIVLEDGREIEVLDVHEKDGNVWHSLSEPIEVGTKVHGK
ncbi:MAG: alanine--tRNA ligase-related protein, partial [Lachnospiraceae bacterium]|nr:alanine--tRNA ligase-related protein [Lachnospiraceae bacterium]